MVNKDITIIISSCDAYNDAWEPFFTLFFRYWPDCPFSLYLISGSKVYPDTRVTTLRSAYPDWGRSLKSALSQILSQYIIYLQEDYFLKRKVDTDFIVRLTELARTEHAGYLRLYPSPGPTSFFKNYRDVGFIENNAPYRTSLQAALWDKNVLMSLLQDGAESGADFEKRTPELSAKIDQQFLSVRRGIFFPYDRSAAVDYLATGIVKRCWNRSVVHLFRKEKIKHDFSGRTFEPWKNYVKHVLTSLPFVGIFFRYGYRLYYGVKLRILSTNNL